MDEAKAKAEELGKQLKDALMDLGNALKDLLIADILKPAIVTGLEKSVGEAKNMGDTGDIKKLPHNEKEANDLLVLELRGHTIWQDAFGTKHMNYKVFGMRISQQEHSLFIRGTELQMGVANVKQIPAKIQEDKKEAKQAAAALPKPPADYNHGGKTCGCCESKPGDEAAHKAAMITYVKALGEHPGQNLFKLLRLNDDWESDAKVRKIMIEAVMIVKKKFAKGGGGGGGGDEKKEEKEDGGDAGGDAGGGGDGDAGGGDGDDGDAGDAGGGGDGGDEKGGDDEKKEDEKDEKKGEKKGGAGGESKATGPVPPPFDSTQAVFLLLVEIANSHWKAIEGCIPEGQFGRDQIVSSLKGVVASSVGAVAATWGPVQVGISAAMEAAVKFVESKLADLVSALAPVLSKIAELIMRGFALKEAAAAAMEKAQAAAAGAADAMGSAAQSAADMDMHGAKGAMHAAGAAMGDMKGGAADLKALLTASGPVIGSTAAKWKFESTPEGKKFLGAISGEGKLEDTIKAFADSMKAAGDTAIDGAMKHIRKLKPEGPLGFVRANVASAETMELYAKVIKEGGNLDPFADGLVKYGAHLAKLEDDLSKDGGDTKAILDKHSKDLWSALKLVAVPLFDKTHKLSESLKQGLGSAGSEDDVDNFTSSLMSVQLRTMNAVRVRVLKNAQVMEAKTGAGGKKAFRTALHASIVEVAPIAAGEWWVAVFSLLNAVGKKAVYGKFKEEIWTDIKEKIDPLDENLPDIVKNAPLGLKIEPAALQIATFAVDKATTFGLRSMGAHMEKAIF